MSAGTAFLNAIDLFRAGQGGYATYRIPGLVVTPAGSVLAYCEARKSGRGDWGAIDILMRRSRDGGETWEAARRLATDPGTVAKNPVALQQGLASADERACNNPVAIVDRANGAVHFLYCVEYARCFYRRSDDDGRSFNPARDITAAFEAFRPEYDWRVIATGPGHGIQLDNGRLLVPVWLSTGTGGHAHRPSVVSVIASDDHGRMWQRGEIVVADSAATPNPSETVAIQLRDGRVMLNIRNESRRNRRLVSCSADGLGEWSEPVFDEALFEPVCFGSMARLSGGCPPSQDCILFVNPASQDSAQGPNARGAWPRENLMVRLSYDGGQTWPVARGVDPGVAGYADLASGDDGTITCLYEGGSVDGSMYHNVFLRLLRFNLAWLTEGQNSI